MKEFFLQSWELRPPRRPENHQTHNRQLFIINFMWRRGFPDIYCETAAEDFLPNMLNAGIMIADLGRGEN